MNEHSFDIIYNFQFDRNDRRDFKVTIDSEAMEMIPARHCENLAWTKLEYRQCPCCQLTKDDHPFCPIATNIAGLVQAFQDKMSYEKCIVLCKTPERTYLKKTSLMEGLASLLGLVMATSRCGHMALFKPMARFHLPFATLEETAVRATAMYLLNQYFVYKGGRGPDWDLKRLHEHYEAINMLNECLMERLLGLHPKDADINAIDIFHCISELLSAEIRSNLDTIKNLFEKMRC